MEITYPPISLISYFFSSFIFTHFSLLIATFFFFPAWSLLLVVQVSSICLFLSSIWKIFNLMIKTAYFFLFDLFKFCPVYFLLNLCHCSLLSDPAPATKDLCVKEGKKATEVIYLSFGLRPSVRELLFCIFRMEILM